MYAIQVIGYGKKTHYSLRDVIGGTSYPISKPYRTLEAAQAEADRLGITVEKIGDVYEIFAAADRA